MRAQVYDVEYEKLREVYYDLEEGVREQWLVGGASEGRTTWPWARARCTRSMWKGV